MPSTLIPRIPGRGGLIDPSNITPPVNPTVTTNPFTGQGTPTPTGGGGGTATALPPATVPPSVTPTVNIPALDVGSLRSDELQAAIDAIEARFGMTEAQLNADQTAVGSAWRMLKIQLAKALQAEQQDIRSSFAQRGGLRSGLRLKAENEAAAKFFELRSRRQAEKDAAMAQLQSALDALAPQQTLEEATTRALFGDAALSDEERAALAAGA